MLGSGFPLYTYLTGMTWGTEGCGSHLGEGLGEDPVSRQAGTARLPEGSLRVLFCLCEVWWRMSCGRSRSSPCLQALEVRLRPTSLKHFVLLGTCPGSCKEGGLGVTQRLGGQLGGSYGRLSKTLGLLCARFEHVCVCTQSCHDACE